MPGLALLVAAIGGAAAGALRSRRLGPAAAALGVAALTAGGYWLVHASLDWFWTYAAVTAPVCALMGSACAPATLAPASRSGDRKWLMAALVLFALTLDASVPQPTASTSDDSTWRSDPVRAYSDLDKPAPLDPLTAEPCSPRARSRVSRAMNPPSPPSGGREKRPDEWASPLLPRPVFSGRPPGAGHPRELARASSPARRRPGCPQHAHPERPEAPVATRGGPSAQ